MLKDSRENKINMIRITLLLLVCAVGLHFQSNQGDVHGFSVIFGPQRLMSRTTRIIPTSNRNDDPSSSSYKQHSTLIIKSKQGQQQHRWTRLSQATKDSSSRTSEKSSSSQDVHEMASFLAMQFFDVLLKDALNDGEESVMGTTVTTETTAPAPKKDTSEDEDKDIEDLLNEDIEVKKEATSSSSSFVDTEEGESTTTPKPVELEAPKPLEIDANATAEKPVTLEKEEEEEPVPLPEIPEEGTTKMEGVDIDDEKKDEDEKEPVDSSNLVSTIQPKGDRKNTKSDFDDKEAPSTSLDEMSPVENVLAATEGDVDDEVTSSRSDDAITYEGAEKAVAVRIPSIVSTNLGRPLEIVTSSVPPLRDTSFLSKSSSNQKSSTETSTTLSAISTSFVEDQQKTKKEHPQVDDLPQPPSPSTLTLEDAELPLSNDERSDDMETQTEHVVLTEDTSRPQTSNVKSPTPIDDRSVDDILIPPTQNVQAPNNYDPSRQEERSPPSSPSSSKLTTPKIAEDRFEAIVKARRQPKPPDEEATLAARYGAMSPSVRAFAVLFDLGMIDCNKDPAAPGYDHSNDDELCDQYYI